MVDDAVLEEWVDNIEQAVINKISQILGHDAPVGTKDLMHCLAHPDVIVFTQTWLTLRKEIYDGEGLR